MEQTGSLFYQVLFIAFSVSAAVQLFYYFFFYISLHFYRKRHIQEPGPPVSVIICARNEAANLEKFLPYVMGQVYPVFEVIVVNDCSEDKSYDVLGTFLQRYPNLKVSSINKDPKFAHSKKFAQFIGIKAASYEYLLFTDADCLPESEKWLESMVSNFTPGTEIVLGYGGYQAEKGLLNSYVRYDTMFIAMQYLGMAIRGFPYMGVGRNLAYSKELFFRKRGYGTFNHLTSGDDDLFVNSNSSSENTKVEFTPGSATRSVAARNLTEWIKQKNRHFSTAKYYRFRDKILLIIEPFTRLAFYALFTILIVTKFFWPYLIAIFGLRLISQLIVFGLVKTKLGEKKILLNSLIFDIFSPLINMLLYIGSPRYSRGRKAWK